MTQTQLSEELLQHLAYIAREDLASFGPKRRDYTYVGNGEYRMQLVDNGATEELRAHGECEKCSALAAEGLLIWSLRNRHMKLTAAGEVALNTYH